MKRFCFDNVNAAWCLWPALCWPFFLGGGGGGVMAGGEGGFSYCRISLCREGAKMFEKLKQ